MGKVSSAHRLAVVGVSHRNPLQHPDQAMYFGSVMLKVMVISARLTFACHVASQSHQGPVLNLSARLATPLQGLLIHFLKRLGWPQKHMDGVLGATGSIRG